MPKLTCLKVAVAFILAAVGATDGAIADTITVRADRWCPYICVTDPAEPGYLVEVAREALAKGGHELDFAEINWVRSIEETRAGKWDAVIGAYQADAPDFVYPAEPLGTSADGFAVRKGVTFRYQGPRSLDGLVLGKTRGLEFPGELGEYINANRADHAKVQETSGVDALAQNLRKLAAGRVDVVLDNEAVLRWTIRSLGVEGQLEIADRLEAEGVYMAFSPARDGSRSYATLLATGVAELRASGRMGEILARYGLRDRR